MLPAEAQQGSGQKKGRGQGNVGKVAKTTTVAQAVKAGAKSKRARPAETQDTAAAGMCKCTAATLLANGCCEETAGGHNMAQSVQACQDSLLCTVRICPQAHTCSKGDMNKAWQPV